MGTDDKTGDVAFTLESTDPTEQPDINVEKQEAWFLFPIDEVVLDALLTVSGLQAVPACALL
jgi:hypothetical protein